MPFPSNAATTAHGPLATNVGHTPPLNYLKLVLRVLALVECSSVENHDLGFLIHHFFHLQRLGYYPHPPCPHTLRECLTRLDRSRHSRIVRMVVEQEGDYCSRSFTAPCPTPASAPRTSAMTICFARLMRSPKLRSVSSHADTISAKCQDTLSRSNSTSAAL